MLPAASRMTRSADFAEVIRGGRRVGAATVVVHHRPVLRPGQTAPVVGLVVSRAVGDSVVRHRVSRRLRAQLAERLDQLPETSGTVVRALPSAATATSRTLGADLERALGRAVRAGRA